MCGITLNAIRCAKCFGFIASPRPHAVDALESTGLHAAESEGVALERDGLADGALRREAAELPHGELPLLEDLERRLSRRARRADDRDGDARRHQYVASSSFTTRSPISPVPTSLSAGPAMSRVR